jgi:hypothetical protein
MTKGVEIEWPAEDIATLAHTSIMKVDGRQLISPLQVVCSPHKSVTATQSSKIPSLSERGQAFSPLIIIGETLRFETVDGVGRDEQITDDLSRRMKERMIPGRVNLIFPRVPLAYHPKNGPEFPPPRIDRARASALVWAQLESDASLIIPPLPAGLSSITHFSEILEHTQIEIQTFKASKEIVGFIPTTDHLEIVRDMVQKYIQIGCRVFAVDFSGASNRPSMMRSLVGTIRKSLRIKDRATESNDKYYLHVFDVAANKKSINPITPITDILIHPYGVDSTSGTIWGGGSTKDTDKLRYYRTDDYGAYRPRALARTGIKCGCPVCRKYDLSELYSGSVPVVLGRLQEHRLHASVGECRRISEKIASSEGTKGYLPYLDTKTEAQNEIAKIIEDVREIKASL